MKKILFSILFLIITYTLFSQNNEQPSFMVEVNTGYAIGVNLDNTIQIDTRLYYPIERFGFTVEVGSFIQDESLFRILFAPMMCIINTSDWRVPFILGMDVKAGDNSYFGIGGAISVHRKLTNYFYAGFNLSITNYLIHSYREFVGYRIETIIYNEETFTKNVPVFEDKRDFGSRFYFKPSFVIGLHF
jgi:hypothetical protein